MFLSLPQLAEVRCFSYCMQAVALTLHAEEAQIDSIICMVLRTCVHVNQERRLDLVQPGAAGNLLSLLLSAHIRPAAESTLADKGEEWRCSHASTDEWLRRLVAEVCCSGRLFVELYTSLQTDGTTDGECLSAASVRRCAQGNLLLVLADALDSGFDVPPGGSTTTATPVRCSFLQLSLVIV